MFVPQKVFIIAEIRTLDKELERFIWKHFFSKSEINPRFNRIFSRFLIDALSQMTSFSKP